MVTEMDAHGSAAGRAFSDRGLFLARAALLVMLGAVVVVENPSRPGAWVLGLTLAAIAAIPFLFPRPPPWQALGALLLGDVVLAGALWWVVPSGFAFLLTLAAVLIATASPRRRTGFAVTGLAALVELAHAAALVGGAGPVAGTAGGAVAHVAPRLVAIVAAALGGASLSGLLEQTRAALETSRRRLRALLQASPSATLYVVDGEVRHANTLAAELLGVGRLDDLTGVSIDAVLDGEFGTLYRRFIDEGAITRDERIVLEDRVGPSRVLEVSLTRVHDEDGDVVRISIDDVTDRCGEEIALREAEQRFRAAFANAATPFVITELDLSMSEVNRAFATLLGQEREELIGRSWREIVHPEDHALILEMGTAQLADPMGTFSAEARLMAADGRVIVGVIDVAVLPGPDGRPRRFFALVHDVTGHRRAEAALRRSEERYRSLFERLPVALYRTTPEGRIVDGNQALATLLGIDDIGDVFGRDAADFYAKRAARHEVAGEVLRRGVVFGKEWEAVRPDGSHMWVADSSRLVETEEGTFFEGALIDVTARRRVEAELRARAKQQEAVAALGQFALEAADPDRIFPVAVDVVRDVLDVDATALLELGPRGRMSVRLARGSLAGLRTVSRSLAGLTVGSRDPIVLRTPEEVSFTAPELAELGFHSGASVLVPGAERPFGALWAFTLRPRLFTPDDLHFLVAIGNVLAAAVDRHRSRTRLEELIRSKDEFLASVSHELRTPLTVVTGMACELHDRWRDFTTEEMGELTRMLADESLDLADLIEDLLVAARADVGEVTIHAAPLELSKEISATVDTLRRTVRKPIRVGNTSGRVVADAVRLRQILRNLITNADRYGGEHIEIDCAARDDGIAVRVVDDGEGIPMEARERIFDPYQRAYEHPGRPGSVGLGLTVSRTLARLMGGDLVYDYVDGKSVFELIIPFAVESPSVAAVESRGA